MNDGDGKDSVSYLNEREKRPSKRKKRSGVDDEYTQAIARIAVAQICESSGFQSFQQSASDVLADVGVRYIREIGKTASFYANLANRSQCNVFDVIRGLEDLGSVQGFSGASDVGHSPSRSGVVRDIIRYVGQAEDIPFAYLIPGFPVVKEVGLNPSFAQAEVNPPDKHIPSWLPKFPDLDKNADLDSGNLKDMKTGVDNKIQQVEEQDGKVDRTLLNSQPKLNCNGSEAAVAVELGDAAKVQRAAESNPFLAHPLQFDQKDVSLPVLPAKLLDGTMGHHSSHEVVENHISVSEPSLLPGKEDASGSLCEPEDRRNILLHGRPNVHFKFGNGKKSLGMAKSSGKEGVEKICLWFSDENDRKDEKKRPEQILSEDMEYSHEVSHLYQYSEESVAITPLQEIVVPDLRYEHIALAN
ncbi:hypothetical protein BUALT_Bualt04G0135200 [Buddleja alternifolia]|uniref:Bromodomain associated domain-containing protein n=1 Tax=Buddleja alternifolia TaxID=168488 RepID=A0AAV6XT32_9LAMI|nr:hypothetical protein BUALT_Bualt04G0135200 [Buddleja alternifolia]